MAEAEDVLLGLEEMGASARHGTQARRGQIRWLRV